MDLGIRGKTALICAASKGLGKGCAVSLAREGVNLVITARGADALEATAAELRKFNVTVKTVAGDITTAEGRGIAWVTVWETATDAAEFVDAIGQGIQRRYETSAPRVARNGTRTYSGSRRTVVITPLERDGRNVVLYVDVPEGASTSVIDPARITIGR